MLKSKNLFVAFVLVLSGTICLPSVLTAGVLLLWKLPITGLLIGVFLEPYMYHRLTYKRRARRFGNALDAAHQATHAAIHRSCPT
jgi:Flp pilus assembly protein TadB